MHPAADGGLFSRLDCAGEGDDNRDDETVGWAASYTPCINRSTSALRCALSSSCMN